MLRVTFYNKKTQLRLDQLNSFSITTQPAEPADSMPMTPCFTRISEGILSGTTIACRAMTGPPCSAVVFPALRAECFAGSWSTGQPLLTATDRASVSCFQASPGRSATHPPQPHAPLTASPPRPVPGTHLPTRSLERAGPEKGRTNSGQRNPL